MKLSGQVGCVTTTKLIRFWGRSESVSGYNNYLTFKVILHHWEIGRKTIYGVIFQKCIGPEMFSWIRHCMAEVFARPSVLLVFVVMWSMGLYREYPTPISTNPNPGLSCVPAPAWTETLYLINKWHFLSAYLCVTPIMPKLLGQLLLNLAHGSSSTFWWTWATWFHL